MLSLDRWGFGVWHLEWISRPYYESLIGGRFMAIYSLDGCLDVYESMDWLLSLFRLRLMPFLRLLCLFVSVLKPVRKLLKTTPFFYDIWHFFSCMVIFFIISAKVSVDRGLLCDCWIISR